MYWLVLAALAAMGPADPNEATSMTVDAAVAELRRVVVAEIPKDQLDAKRARCGEAERVLSTSGEAGARAIEAELRRMREAGETDVFFQGTSAQALLRALGPAGAAAAADALRGVDPQTQLMYLWEAISMAAAMRDPRALPLLRIALATDEAARPAMFLMHGVTLPWPQFLDVIYGTYGRAACDDLEAVASSAVDGRVAVSAAHALSGLRCHGAAPLLRRWAASRDAPRAAAALAALGTLGDPADRALLLACARHHDVAVRRGCAYAIVEFGDPSLVPVLVELARAEDGVVRREAVIGLLRTPTPEGGRAALAAREKLGDDRAGIEDQLRAMARWNGVDAEALLAGDEAAWKALSTAELQRRETVLARRPDDPELTREELAAALARWEEDARVTRVVKRSLLAVATADDLPALYRVRARVLERQSDEALDEIALLEHVIRVLDRRRMGVRYPNL